MTCVYIVKLSNYIRSVMDDLNGKNLETFP